MNLNRLNSPEISNRGKSFSNIHARTSKGYASRPVQSNSQLQSRMNQKSRVLGARVASNRVTNNRGGLDTDDAGNESSKHVQYNIYSSASGENINNA